ncbi:MAG: hypothetical protein K2N94_14575 [Lachnospiraceae bacterium]|nr:hypothetical protein [Lachnospiraceae bacterium]
MAMEITGNYGGYTAQATAESSAAGSARKKETDGAMEIVRNDRAESVQDYAKKLQKQVPYMTLEVGSSLSMSRDKRGGVLTVHPKLLEKMQNDPEFEKEYIQRMKDIERAEKTADAYYNALGGCVERTSHWYIDENGKYYHFAYTVRDDKLNKKLRKERQENAEKLIEETRKKTEEKREELKTTLEKTAESREKSEKKGREAEERIPVPNRVKQLFDEKTAASKDGTVYFNHTEIQEIIEAVKGGGQDRASARKRPAAGANLDLQA